MRKNECCNDERLTLIGFNWIVENKRGGKNKQMLVKCKSCGKRSYIENSEPKEAGKNGQKI